MLASIAEPRPSNIMIIGFHVPVEEPNREAEGTKHGARPMQTSHGQRDGVPTLLLNMPHEHCHATLPILRCLQHAFIRGEAQKWKTVREDDGQDQADVIAK